MTAIISKTRTEYSTYKERIDVLKCWTMKMEKKQSTDEGSGEEIFRSEYLI